MSAPVLPSSGAATVNRKWVYEFNTSNNPSAPTWTVIGAVKNSQFQPDAPNWVSDTKQSGKGFESSTKTGATWSGTLTVGRNPTLADPTQYDPAQEFIRTHSIGVFGPGNTIQVRVSEYDPNDPNGLVSPRVEAYTGFCGVSWVPQGGDMLAEDDVQITLTGQDALSIITHPYPAAATVPVISAVSPNTGLLAAGGGGFEILGHGFTGTVVTTGVKFGGTNATSWTVISDSKIIGVYPAHAAGSGVVVLVTNATGPSVGGPTVQYV